MQPKSLKLLEDIREAAAFIRDTTLASSIERHRQDKLLRFAIERNFEIIGEAIKRLASVDQQAAMHIGDYRQIIAFRNSMQFAHPWHRIVSLRRVDLRPSQTPTPANTTATSLP